MDQSNDPASSRGAECDVPFDICLRASTKCTNRRSASTPYRLTGHLDGAMPCANRDAEWVGGAAFPSVQLCDGTARLPGGCRDFHLSLRIVNLADVSKLRVAVDELRHLHGSGRAYR